MLSFLSQSNLPNLPTFFLRNVVWSLSDNVAQGFYQCNAVWSLSDSIALRFSVQCCPGFEPVNCRLRTIKINLHRSIFLSNVVWSLSDNTVQGFYQRNVVPVVLRQHCTGFFLEQYCRELLRKKCTGFLSLQCCPRNIHRIFLMRCCLEPLRQNCVDK